MSAFIWNNLNKNNNKTTKNTKHTQKPKTNKQAKTNKPTKKNSFLVEIRINIITGKLIRNYLNIGTLVSLSRPIGIRLGCFSFPVSSFSSLSNP